MAAARLDVAQNHKTVYMWGVFGAPVTESVIAGKTKQYPSWYTSARQAAFRKLIGKGYFGFDCVCLLKGLLWGWNGDASKTYGGASYTSNGVPDIGANSMIGVCKEVSTTGWDKMEVGEAVWMEGHIGVYVGNGLAVECTPKWDNCVQVTAVLNIGSKSGYKGRKWTKHGKLPYVTYTGKAEEKPNTGAAEASGTFNVGDIVEFTGNTHYSSANAAEGPACKAGRAKITATAEGSKHPYHCRAVNDAGEFTSGVYGWVDATDIKAIATTPATVLTGTATTGSNEDVVAILEVLLDKGLTLAGACGVLASIKHESGFRSDNLENTGNTKLSMTDKEYTEAVDSGKYTDFDEDRCGYGLFQHTYPTRKAEMLAFFQARNKSIADWKTQVDFAFKELEGGLQECSGCANYYQ